MSAACCARPRSRRRARAAPGARSRRRPAPRQSTATSQSSSTRRRGTGRAPVQRRLDGFCADGGAAYAKAVRAFADAGWRYLQLDEVYIAMLCDPKYRRQVAERGDDPKQLGRIYADLINTAISDIPPDMTITMHLCRGNYRSTHMGAGGYEAVQEILFDRTNVHGYFMEFDSERAGAFEPLRLLPQCKTTVL